MYSVSEAYLEQMMKKGIRRRLTGTIGSVAFTGNDVVRDSFSVTAKATEESDTKIGGVYLGEIEMTFVPSFLSKVPRNEFEGKTLSVSIGLLVEDTWVDVPVGVFTLQAPKISKQGITVSGYDNMQKLDKSFTIDSTVATPFGYLSYIATQCNVQLAQSQAEIEALPNGSEAIGIYEENDIETYRDLLYWLAQTCGCFACADRTGKIALRKFGVLNDIDFDENHRDADVVFSGYTTKWTGISIVDIATKTTRYYGLEVDDGLTMNLGSNPLLQLGTSEAIERRRRAVLNAIAEIQYTPFYCNSARDPIYDLGDVINFSGGISGNCSGCIMSYSYSLGNCLFEGYGDNPVLSDAKSKTDKNISGLMQSTQENEVTYYTFTNLESITFSSEQEVTIASLAFTSAQTTTVKIMHEFIFDMIRNIGISGSYELRYYLDEELVSYKPYESLAAISASVDIPVEDDPQTEEQEEYETIDVDIAEPTEFSITRDFFYVIQNVAPNQRHTWQVRIITHGIEETTIDVEHAHVVLEGQRLYGSEYFDGFVEIRENINRISLVGMGVNNSISEDVDFDFTEVPFGVASDNIRVYEIDTIGLKDLSDRMQMYIESLNLKRHTEDGYNRITEDGYRRISE